MWLYKGEEFTDDMIGENVGFVYEIMNLTNGRKYIGKKLFTKSKRYQKKGKKRSKRVASDWIEYTGSNEELNEDVANGDSIHKRILYICASKGMMSYLESKEIFTRDCLLDDRYYNKWVSCRVRSSHLK